MNNERRSARPARPAEIQKHLGKEALFPDDLDKFPAPKNGKDFECKVVEKCIGETDDGEPIFCKYVVVTDQNGAIEYMDLDDFNRSARNRVAAGKKRRK